MTSSRVELCRACFKESIELRQVFELCDCFNITIAQMLKECCQIQIKDDKMGSTMICMMCLKLLHISYDFKQSCQKAQHDFEKLKFANDDNNETKFKNEYEIKQEIDHFLDDNGYTDCLTKVKIELSNLKEDTKIDNKVLRIKEQAKRAEKRYKCSECDKRFRDRDHLNNHFIVNHQINKPKIQCPNCPRTFSLKKYVNQHIKRFHEMKSVRKIDQVLSCKECNKTFRQKRSLDLHYLAQHLNRRPEITCTFCTKIFTHKSNLRRHIRTCHQHQRPFKCDTCSNTFTTKIAQVRHTEYVCKVRNGEGQKKGDEDVEVEKKSCEICNLKFYENCLDKHIQQHHDPLVEKVTCNQCQLVFVCQKDLKYHQVRKHAQKEKSHLCSICGKAYFDAYRLREHFAGHTKETLHQCKHCAKMFRTYSSYFMHLRVHTNTRKYKCQFCQKDFIQSQHLKAHVRQHTGEKPYSCDICARSFSMKTNRDAHRRTHTGEKPYECTLCKEKFYDAGRLSKHKRKTHFQGDPNDDPPPNIN